LAVDGPAGLLAPVFAEPDMTDAESVDADMRATVQVAQRGKVDAAHLMAANGTLSNLGGMGIERFQALVTPPQATVLSVGAVRRIPIATEHSFHSVLAVTAGLTVDHRVADGADGARLLWTMATNLEQSDA
jgi:pyruvate dehydrogenase E2 component (dihydrolipoamide acetyltransferase)